MSVLTPIDFCHAWEIFGPLVDKNTRKGELVELPASDTWGLSFIRIRSLPLKSFLDFFLNVVPYQLESWFIHWVGCTTYWVHVSLDTFTDAVKGRIRQSLTALVDLCSHYRIIMKFSGVITNDQGKVHAKGQGQRSKADVTEVTTQLNCFQTVTPVWSHIW